MSVSFFSFSQCIVYIQDFIPTCKFSPSVNLVPLFFITLEILYPEGIKCGFKSLLKENKVFIR